MDIKEVIRTRRTIRKFSQEPIDRPVLVDLVEGARLAPSAANIQPLHYLIIDEPDLLDGVFETLSWAGYIAPKGNPREGEMPVAYIVVLADTELNSSWDRHDSGAAVQNIMLEAWSMGIGTCWLGAVKRDKLRETFKIPERYHIDTVVALGYPAEKSVSEDEKGSIRYYKDEDGVLHVPKRRIEDIVYINGF